MTTRYPTPPPIRETASASVLIVPRMVLWQTLGTVRMLPVLYRRQGVRAILHPATVLSLILAVVLMLVPVALVLRFLFDGRRLLDHGANVGDMLEFVLVWCARILGGYVIVIVAVAATLRLRRSRLYVDAGHTTALTISTTRDGWKVHGFVTRTPGRGVGRKFAQTVIAELTPTVDACGIPIYAEANVEELADLYQRLVPGMRVVRRARGTIHLRRAPGTGGGGAGEV